MKNSITLPKLSATMEEAVIANWVKNVGEAVSEGDVLYELETDKATMEVESTLTGVLTNILVQPGVPVPVGTPVCEITSSSQTAEAVQETSDENIATEIKRLTLRVSPSARRLARELNVDLATVQGTGPMGRIRNRDVEKQAAQQQAEKLQAEKLQIANLARNAKQTSVSVPATSLNNGIPVSRMRSTIAKEMVRSTQTIPTFWVEKWVNAEHILKWKNLLRELGDPAFSKLTITDFVLQAMGLALEEMPTVNRRWIERADNQPVIEAVPGTHVGLAISVEGGIIAPVLTDVGSVPLGEIIKKRMEAIEAIRSNRPFASDKPAAITLSNLGNTRIDRFRAIIKPDESMILALGGLQEKPVVQNGQVIVQSGFTMVLSADHRLIDGMEAAQYLAEVARIIESGKWKIT
jgi:pyruvate dehydrogenase E2 component (dihydrolipoamide acetyltransferase)